MALATSVTGTGKLISSRIEGSGSFSYVSNDDGTLTNHSITYTDVRETRKWHALTLTACTNYQAAHPNDNTDVECVNEVIGAYELTTETVTRTVVAHSSAEISEAT